MKKITAPEATTHGPHQPANPDTVWFINGVAYTDNYAMLAYFGRRPGFVIEDGAPDADHLAAVAAAQDEAARTGVHTSRLRDAADPARPNYFSGRA